MNGRDTCNGTCETAQGCNCAPPLGRYLGDDENGPMYECPAAEVLWGMVLACVVVVLLLLVVHGLAVAAR